MTSTVESFTEHGTTSEHADAVTSLALLNCLVREVAAPEEQVRPDGRHLLVRLARADRLLRLTLRRKSSGVGPRLTGEAAELRQGSWYPVRWDRLAELIAEEMAFATGTENEDFLAQVAASHDAVTSIVQRKLTHAHIPVPVEPSATEPEVEHPVLARYLASEQALVAGHLFHPAPKARGRSPEEWLRYAPETGARMPLRFLGIRADAVAEEGSAAALRAIDGLGAFDKPGACGEPGGADAPGVVAPEGYRLLPAHPWQLRLLDGGPWLTSALREGLLLDLGESSRAVVPTSSVRTVYDPSADVFCKFSLGVRITNCVRTHAWYELSTAVALTKLLGPVFAEIAAAYPGTVLLGEPAYRTVAAADRDAFEGLAVILREGVRARLDPGVTPLLAAALAVPHAAGPPAAALPSDGPSPVGQEPAVFHGRTAAWLSAWWEAYVRRLVPPVLHAYLAHGVVMEPHQQNVLVGVDSDEMPVQIVHRDLEGTKLLAGRHQAALAAFPPRAAEAVTYDAERGWRRVVYCLFVNHLAEMAASITDRHPGLEGHLWRCVRSVVAGYAREHGSSPRIRELLAGVPLPAKANLWARWTRAADRRAGYVHVPNPLRPA